MNKHMDYGKHWSGGLWIYFDRPKFCNVCQSLVHTSAFLLYLHHKRDHRGQELSLRPHAQWHEVKTLSQLRLNACLTKLFCNRYNYASQFLKLYSAAQLGLARLGMLNWQSASEWYKWFFCKTNKSIAEIILIFFCGRATLSVLSVLNTIWSIQDLKIV